MSYHTATDTAPTEQPAVDTPIDLAAEAKAILGENDRGEYTVPAENLYPHQWLWDSCFIAIGLRHMNTDRAQTELRSLIKGQWSNGMLPNMVFSSSPQ
ncbi:MAG TPA: glycoside hydrolase, partial [Candidatus Saccharibacteria bacterium]|nr:glycoside hydrolase [Candidatus Saccharibacteria bacterium]